MFKNRGSNVIIFLAQCTNVRNSETFPPYILRLEKYEVDHYANGPDGLAAIESDIYDIVILDVMLPGMNGYEITKRARSKGIIRNDETTGVKDSLLFLKADKGECLLVVFMDNTIAVEVAITLFRYTLIFGSIVFVPFFFVSVLLGKKIVDPLEESYQKQRRFVSDAGHELKTPVSVISANAELLSGEVGDNQWLRNIQYENQRMGNLIEQLLDLARTENVPPQLEWIDFSRLVAGEALPFESVAFEKGLGLAIAKAIAAAHHGGIEVRCYDGLVEFRINFPAK